MTPRGSSRGPSRGQLAVLAFVALAFAAAPTAGDVGGCGKDVADLDASKFASDRKALDCRRCTECGITTARCGRACNAAIPSEVAIPASCRPLAHDGDVCLRALAASSCDDYRDVMDDIAPTVPTECAFCRFDGAVAP